MGMSAAQAKLLSLTARRSDINYQLSSLMRGKLDLMTQASNAADMLADSKRNNNIFVLTTSDNQQTELSFNSLSKEGLTIVDAKGRTIVPSSYKTNPKGLTSILPASHPSVKSYDGDFVVKDKLNKNYVSIPQNQIPIFDNSKDFQQKYVKVSSDEPTVTSKFVEQNSIYSSLPTFYTDSIGAVDTLFDFMNTNYKDYYMVVGKQGNYNDWFTNNNIDENKAKAFTFEKSTGRDTFATEFSKLFASELGKGSVYVSNLNNSLGCDGYTAYNKRQFQYTTSVEQSRTRMQNKIGDKMDTVSYVSNAEQLITALLKDAKLIKDGKLESNANIMLLNDINLDDMLKKDNDSDKTTRLQDFIEEEMVSAGVSREKLDYLKTYKDTSSTDRTKIELDIANVLRSPDKVSNSGIKGDVLLAIWNKYFRGDADDFNEDFTNFIQIDKFTGAIGGGGFAINNLKMDTKNGQFAGMFGEVAGALLDGIWMENAQVLSSQNNGANTHNAAILAKNLTGESFVNVSAQGQQFTIGDRMHKDNNFQTSEFLKLAANGYKMKTSAGSKSNLVNAGWSIVAVDNRSDSNMKDVYKDVTGSEPTTYGMSGDNGYMDCGFAFKSYNTYAGGDNKTTHNGWRTVAADIEDSASDKRLVSSASGRNVGEGFAAFDTKLDNTWFPFCINTTVREYNRVTNTVGDTDGDGIGDVSALKVIFDNAGKTNSKIKIYKKEDVNEYKAPDIEGSWKENAKFDDGTEINWNDWEVIDGSFNSETGEYALVKKHGEETEEYLSVMSLLEFYKEQGVNIDINEDRESGFLTYSAYGYSVDVEYKDDLEKYNSDPYLYKVENNDSSLLIYERDKVNDVDISQLVFVDDIEALLDKNIKNGVWFIQGASVSDAAKFERKSLDEIGISETTDENANNIAQAEYERKMRDIELQEEKFDAQITELENTLKGIEQEIENQQKIVKQNIQSSFSTFAS